MITSKPVELSSGLTDPSTAVAQRMTPSAPTGAIESVLDTRHDSATALSRAAERAGALAQRSLEAARDSSQRLRAQARRASESTVNYIKEEPVKSVLIAAATGAALMALINLISRSRSHD